MKRDPLSILVIEPDARVAADLYDYLESCGHSVEAALDGLSGFGMASSGQFDVILLDWDLPRLDGLALLQRLRLDARSMVPVVMWTSRNELSDKICGFESGLDDYLIKPVSFAEIEVRLRARVVRKLQSSVPRGILSLGDVVFNLSTMEVRRGERPIMLSRIGRRLLELLMRESPHVVTRERLARAVWGESLPGTDLLRSHIYILRRALELPSEAALLHTVSGIGYRMHALDP